MNPGLEIIIPIRNGCNRLLPTTASLVAQTDRRFAVLLSDEASVAKPGHLDEAQQELTAAGISVRRLHPPCGLQPLEHWNWAHAQSPAGWFKLLLPGEQLRPAFVARLGQLLGAKPATQVASCDLELRTEWGPRRLPSPFPHPAV